MAGVNSVLQLSPGLRKYCEACYGTDFACNRKCKPLYSAIFLKKFTKELQSETLKNKKWGAEETYTGIPILKDPDGAFSKGIPELLFLDTEKIPIVKGELPFDDINYFYRRPATNEFPFKPESFPEEFRNLPFRLARIRSLAKEKESACNQKGCQEKAYPSLADIHPEEINEWKNYPQIAFHGLYGEYYLYIAFPGQIGVYEIYGVVPGQGMKSKANPPNRPKYVPMHRTFVPYDEEYLDYEFEDGADDGFNVVVDYRDGSPAFYYPVYEESDSPLQAKNEDTSKHWGPPNPNIEL